MSDEQYFAQRPQSKSLRSRVDAGAKQYGTTWQVAGTRLHLVSDHGVFSRQGIDAGTAVLIEQAPRPPDNGNFLDLGCGSGALAMTLAVLAPQATIWAVDINERALDLTRVNLASNKLRNVSVCTPEGVPDNAKFDLIWSNPPIRIGKKALHELLLRWLAMLRADGKAWLVVQRNLGSDSLADWLAAQGFDVAREASKRGYRVISVAGRSGS